MIIILSANVGALSDENARRLADRILHVSQSHAKPNLLLVQEFGNNATPGALSKNNFGYPKIISSDSFKYNNANNPKVNAENQRVTKTYAPSKDIKVPKDLNVYREIVTIIGKVSMQKGNEMESKDLAIINMYRNHNQGKLEFKRQIDDIVSVATTKYIIAIGDTNYESMKLKAMVELAHMGLHIHRRGQQPGLIDKVFVSQELAKATIRILPMDPVEKVQDNALGHKTLLILINEDTTTNTEITVLQKEKYLLNLKRHFNDRVTNNYISATQRWKISKTNKETNDDIINAANNITDEKTTPYSAIPPKFDVDPAKALTTTLLRIREQSTKKIQRKEPLQIEDLENLSLQKNSSDNVKEFCRAYSVLKSTVLNTNLNLELNHSKERPTTKEICSHIETKLNGGHHIHKMVMDLYSNSLVSTKPISTPDKVTLKDVDSYLSKIKKTKTPWFDEFSAATMVESARESTNLKKVIHKIITATIETGELPLSMNYDRVLFLYKNKGSRMAVENYRPISIDCSLTKLTSQAILEKCVWKLKEYTHRRNFSYRAGVSTITAILTAAQEVETTLLNGQQPVLLFTDMSSAFETIQARLINCLANVKIMDTDEVKTKKWLANYLIGKKLFSKNLELDQEINTTHQTRTTETGEITTMQGTNKQDEVHKNWNKTNQSTNTTPPKNTDGLNHNLYISIKRIKKDIGGGQGSKLSPDLWLLQIGSATYIIEAGKTDIIEEIKQLVDYLNMGFADDSLQLLRLAIEDRLGHSNKIELNTLREVTRKFMSHWEDAIKACGMILNQKKSEILVNTVTTDDKYPPIKNR